VAAGWLALAAGALLIAGASLARRARGAFPAVLDSVADRIFDGTILSAVAWIARTWDPLASAGALVALAAGFLGSYVRVRGTSLGYGVTESPVTRAIRYGLVAAGLISGRVGAAVWTVAALGIVTGVLRATQVAKEERA
jgi:phosphatidylglycerophosphate synthase